MRSLMIYIPHQILFRGSTEKSEISRVCSRYGGEERCRQGFGGKTSDT